jgi:uncharacterized protein (DUF427 family)
MREGGAGLERHMATTVQATWNGKVVATSDRTVVV